MIPGVSASTPASPSSGAARSKQPSNPQTAALIRQLAQTDQKVRTHEQAHIAAAGRYAKSGASFQYQQGPDGQLYAVAGEVSIDTSAVPGDPRATLQKAKTIRNAALAPADPSSQDRAVAAASDALAAQAQIEIAASRQTSPYAQASPKGTLVDFSA
jgi:hypothetical protein